MAIRVTQVILQVLHSGKTAVTGYGDGQYQHDYEAYDMGAVGSYAVEVGTTLQAGDSNANLDPHGAILTGSYFLAGFEEFENAVGQGQYDVDTYDEEEQVLGQGTYTLNAYAQVDAPVGTVEYQLQAYVELEDQKYGNYGLLAYEANETVLQSQYQLDVYLLAQGYLSSLYSLEIYVDLLMHAVSSYDYLTYQAEENAAGTGAYDLNAWEARDQAFIAQYALNTFIESTSYLDTSSQIEVFKLLEEKYGVAYDLNAYKALDGFTDHTYAVSVLQLAQMRSSSQYSLDIYEAFDGFVDAKSVLNAYQAANGFTDGHYGLDVYLSLTGFGDSQHIINALQQVTGYGQGTYLLDTTEELFTWVLNQNTGAPARYEGYGFNAFAAIGQDFLGARGDGIYLLDGDDDDGTDIDAIATIGATDFGAFYENGNEASMLKRVTGAYLGVNSSGQVQLTLVTDQGVSSGPYQLRQSPTARTTERSKFRKGLKSRYWQVDIENADGGDTQVDTLELETKLAEKRLKK
jgi:hypothetical protein